MELEKYIKQKKSLSEEGFLKVMWGGSAKRGQDFDNRPPIWLDDASVLQKERNRKKGGKVPPHDRLSYTDRVY